MHSMNQLERVWRRLTHGRNTLLEAERFYQEWFEFRDSPDMKRTPSDVAEYLHNKISQALGDLPTPGDVRGLPDRAEEVFEMACRAMCFRCRDDQDVSHLPHIIGPNTHRYFHIETKEASFGFECEASPIRRAFAVLTSKPETPPRDPTVGRRT